MGDFGTAVRYLDWVKSRQATLLEAQQAPVPFDKHYNYLKSRAFKKIPYVINIPAHVLSPATDFPYLPRLTFQYRITVPGSFHIIHVSKFGNLTDLSGIVAVRYTKNGITYRYAIRNNFQELHKFSDLYKKQVLHDTMYVEFWQTSTDVNTYGIVKDWKITINLLTNPNFPEEIERPITLEGPFDFPEFSWYLPICLPQDNSIPTTDIPIYLVDENNQAILDENGNKLIVRDCHGNITTILVDENGMPIVDENENQILV